MFKLLRQKNNKYLSLNDGDHCLVYPVEEWIKPKFGKIFVFLEVENALNFIPAQHISDIKYVLYECEVINPLLMSYSALHQEDYRSFWDIMIGGYVKTIELMTTPPYTYVCDAIILTRRII